MFRSRFSSIMKRITKDRSSRPPRKASSSTVDNDVVCSGVKPDLSQFKLSQRPKLSMKVEIKEEPAEEYAKTRKGKRQHIKIEADNEHSSPEKSVKVESKAPNKWEEVLANLREMRKNLDAPVDTMGCDKCPDKTSSAEVIRYQALLSLMLSSQTKDQVTHAAMMRLHAHGCTIDNILATPDEKLSELIYPVNFRNNKVKYIKKTTEILKRDYGGDIPNTVENLCKLPGVGPKMAHICMQVAWDQVTGIGVDTHVHRITNRLGWVKTKTPEETRKQLEEWLPRELWSEVNLLLVGFGQQTCQPVRPQCATCLNAAICPFGSDYVKKNLKSTKK